jgi:small subunit ribosomal protein S21
LVGITLGENESIDKALRRFKKKYERSGVLKEYKKRTFFVKPSIKRRMERLKAERRAHRTDSNM